MYNPYFYRSQESPYTMVTIYHNPRCSKSRQTLQLLQENFPNKAQEIVIIEYLKTPLKKNEIQQLSKLVGGSLRDIIRSSEADYKENNIADASLTNEQLLEAIESMPKLLQRPIVVNGNKAVIGRPPENVLDIL